MSRRWVAALIAASLVACTPPAVAPTPDQPTLTPVAPSTSPAPPARCGGERWPVKTGSDPDVGKISLAESPIPATIAALSALPAPNPIPVNNRVRPVETTVYYFRAILVGFTEQDDGDYHLVLSDGAGHTMTADLVSPECAPAGPLTKQITTARRAFDTRYRPGRLVSLNTPVTVIGVGFFEDVDHGPDGSAPNGIAIHPVLGIQLPR